MDRLTLLTLRARVSELFLSAPDDDVYAQVLEVLLEALASPLGLFGYLDDSGDLVVPSLRGEVWSRCRMTERASRFPRGTWTGLWGQSLVHGETVIANGGLTVPEGHVRIERALSAPIVARGETIGLLMAANAPAPYTELDAHRLEAVAETIAPILHARMARDCEERQRRSAQLALRDHLELLRQMLQSIPSPLFFVGRSGRVEDCNPAFEALVGRPRAAIIGRPGGEVVPPELWAVPPEPEGAARRFATELVAPDGQLRQVVSNEAPVHDSTGGLVGRVGVIEDRTEFRRAEVAVERERNLLRTVMNATRDLIFFKDAEGVYLGCNEAFCEFVGRPEHEIVGRSDYDLFDHAVATFFRGHDRAMLAEGRPRRNEEWVDFPDGRRVALETLKAPLLGADGVAFGIAGVSRDITARKELERELVEARRLAEAGSRAKVAFLAGMSHELRTPLNAVLGFAQVLADDFYGPLTEEQREFVREIAAGGERLLELITDVLDIARLETGRVEVRPEPTLVGSVVERSVAGYRDKAARSGIGLALTADPAVSRRLLPVDVARVGQVMDNLLSNAVKFTPSGGRIQVAVAPEGGGVRVSVADTGIGMEADQLDRIFEPFHQVDESRRNGRDGTGLGMSLARRIIELHGGRIWAESDGPGQGARFTFTLPGGPGEPNGMEPGGVEA